jgi:hypothetical protein
MGTAYLLALPMTIRKKVVSYTYSNWEIMQIDTYKEA